MNWLKTRALFSKRFEDSRGAHASPDAHRHHAVLSVLSSKAVKDGCGPHRTGSTQWVAEGYCATERVDIRWIKFALTDDPSMSELQVGVFTQTVTNI